jgi:hypothetical protein
MAAGQEHGLGAPGAFAQVGVAGLVAGVVVGLGLDDPARGQAAAQRADQPLAQQPPGQRHHVAAFIKGARQRFTDRPESLSFRTTFEGIASWHRASRMGLQREFCGMPRMLLRQKHTCIGLLSQGLVYKERFEDHPALLKIALGQEMAIFERFLFENVSDTRAIVKYFFLDARLRVNLYQTMVDV